MTEYRMVCDRTDDGRTAVDTILLPYNLRRYGCHTTRLGEAKWTLEHTKHLLTDILPEDQYPEIAKVQTNLRLQYRKDENSPWKDMPEE